LMPLGVCVV
jgi:hypothetical protein